MTPQMIICFIICILTIASYIWGKLSMATTALISLILFVVTGCVTDKVALANFGNSNAILLLAMFVVSAGFNRTKFVKSLAKSVNKVAKNNLTGVMAGYIIVTVLMSQFIQSPLVVIGIMAPLMISSCKEMGVNPSQTLLPLGIAAIITCSTLPLGGGATVFGQWNGYLESNGYGQFQAVVTDPMKARLPLLIIMTIYCIFIAPKLAPKTSPIPPVMGDKREEREVEALKPFQEVCGYTIFFLTTIGLIFAKQLAQPTWLIVLIGAVLMIITGVLKPKQAIDSIPWWMGIMFVGSMTMGSALASTGAGDYIGQALAVSIGGIKSPYLIGIIFFVIPFILTQLMQNRTVMMTFMPITILTCKALGANPIGLIAIVEAASLTAFILPMATPAVPQIMGLGGYDIKTMAKQSVIPGIISIVVSVGWIMTVFPMY